MTIAIISDVHGNFDAFEAVLEDIALAGATRIYSLGDNIGYGGEPDRVVRTLMDRGIPSVIGNHELAVREPAQLNWFNPQAREALKRTIDLMSEDALAAVEAFPDWRVADGVRMVHGFPPDCPLTYQFQLTRSEQDDILSAMDEPICFIGHTHYPDILLWDGVTSQRIDFPEGLFTFTHTGSEARWVINVGSVGQPRDGNNNAKYVLYAPENHTVELRYVPYDIEAAAEKILAAGLPAHNARRLW
ncbi:MAG: metallophosphoesterase family protein [Desulfobacterales bacterium]|jgi:diadenosine tetraphosphatase ApaH/serine/threonine PP2A family protein phosphatase